MCHGNACTLLLEVSINQQIAFQDLGDGVHDHTTDRNEQILTINSVGWYVKEKRVGIVAREKTSINAVQYTCVLSMIDINM